jgi:hypothetical protein
MMRPCLRVLHCLRMLNASDGELFMRNSCLLFEPTALSLFLLLSSLLCRPFFASCLVFLRLMSLNRQDTLIISRQYDLHRPFKYYTVFTFSSHVARIELHRFYAKPGDYRSTGSHRFATFFLRRFTITAVLKTEGQKDKKL